MLNNRFVFVDLSIHTDTKQTLFVKAQAENPS